MAGSVAGSMAGSMIARGAALLLAAAALPVAAQSLKADEVLSSLALRPISMPNPVAGSDGRTHLAYELVASNASKLFLTLDRVELLDPAGTVVTTLAGKPLAAMMTLYSGTDTTLPPGGTAVIFLDAAFADAVPASVTARVTLTRQIAGPDGKPAPFPKTQPVPATISFSGAAAVPGKPAVVIAPPLRGPNWLAVNGCCDSVTSHRGAVMSVNGVLRVPERFAIDWVQLDAQHRLYTGAIGRLDSYAYFGTPVHAVADGTVVNLYTSAVEQVPGAPATGITPENIGGNMLVIDIGGGNFAFFAHLQPGSLRVKLGDKVKTGQVIALLGNTGNSDAPHLHFHVMDGPSPLDANGLPYVFTRFTGQGVMDDASADAVFTHGAPAVIDAKALAGAQTNRLPLNNQLVDFGE